MKQIGIMGSMADLWYNKQVEDVAYQLWSKLAKAGYVLVYGAEKDADSLSTAAARGAKESWWVVMGVTYGKTADIRGEMRKYTDCIVCTGMERGWGREFVLVSSCDAIVTIWWWSGTLNEMTVAYQKKIPIVCMKNTGGWSDKMADTYIDDRYISDPKRYMCYGASDATEAIDYLQKLRKNP